MESKAIVRGGKMTDEEIKLALSGAHSERMAQPNDDFEAEARRKLKIEVMYLYRLYSDEQLENVEKRCAAAETYQHLISILFDDFGLRERAVRVFAAMIADYEKRGILNEISRKDNPFYSDCMAKNSSDLISLAFYDYLKTEFGFPYECRRKLPAYYCEDGKIMAGRLDFSTGNVFEVMMARALFADKRPKYARVIELVFFAQSEDIDIDAEIPVPQEFSDAESDLRDVAFLTEAFGLRAAESRMLQYSYNRSLMRDFDDYLDYLLNSDAKYDSDVNDVFGFNPPGRADCDLSAILGFDGKEIAECFGEKSKLLRYGLMDSDGEINEDIRNAISCGDPSLIFRDVIEKDDLANAYPVSTFQVDARITNLAKRLLKSSLPVNIMIYGPAGTGKTEYARALAKECGLECFFFRNESELMEDSGKHPLLRLDAFVGMDDPNRVLVVDEAESILSCADGGFYGISEFCLKKGSVNRMIDGCKAKVIWILNDVETVDKTALRRMTYSISMPRFSPEYIRRLICARLEEENLPPHVLRRVAQLAEKYKVSLATLDNILKALKCSGCM